VQQSSAQSTGLSCSHIHCLYACGFHFHWCRDSGSKMKAATQLYSAVIQHLIAWKVHSVHHIDYCVELYGECLCGCECEWKRGSGGRVGGGVGSGSGSRVHYCSITPVSDILSFRDEGNTKDKQKQTCNYCTRDASQFPGQCTRKRTPTRLCSAEQERCTPTVESQRVRDRSGVHPLLSHRG
jgi:hypothetical protein